MVNGLALCVLHGRLAVCRLPPDASLPDLPAQASFWSATRTEEELSIVLPEEVVSASWKAERGWCCFKVLGPLDFDLTGILASLATSLAEAGVPIFAVSTYDTDYILVKEENLEKAQQALLANGHSVIEKRSPPPLPFPYQEEEVNSTMKGAKQCNGKS